MGIGNVDGRPKVSMIIAGSRGFGAYPKNQQALNYKALLKKYEQDYQFLCRVMDAFPRYPDEVVCGMADGVDLLGKRWADEHGVYVDEHPADWKRHGKKAGYLRNDEMAQVATHCLALWDGNSRGTRHMITIAGDKKLKLYVCLPHLMGMEPAVEVVNIKDNVPFAVRIDRATAWGNPFKMTDESQRDECIRRYRGWLLRGAARGGLDMLPRIPELSGRPIACWCAPKACHGDVLLAFSKQLSKGLPVF